MHLRLDFRVGCSTAFYSSAVFSKNLIQKKLWINVKAMKNISHILEAESKYRLLIQGNDAFCVIWHVEKLKSSYYSSDSKLGSTSNKKQLGSGCLEGRKVSRKHKVCFVNGLIHQYDPLHPLILSNLPSSSYGLHWTACRCGQDTPAAWTQRLRGRVWHNSTAACQETRHSASVWMWRTRHIINDTTVVKNTDLQYDLYI